MSKILRCKKCGDIIQSTHRHNMVACKCGAIAIDGGDDYCKVTGNMEDMEFLVTFNWDEYSADKLKELVTELTKIKTYMIDTLDKFEESNNKVAMKTYAFIVISKIDEMLVKLTHQYENEGEENV